MKEPGSALSNPAVLPIAARAVTVTRDGRNLVAAAEIEIGKDGGPIVILGPNGAGKSVLLRTLAGLLTPDMGRVTWAGTPPDRSRAPRVGFVFQKPVLLRRSVEANVRYALTAAGLPTGERQVRTCEALERGGLAHLASKPARVLSGGEQQRVALTRVLAMRPEILLLDEPTANIDPASTAAIEAALREVHRAGTPFVMVTQDLGQARRLAGEIVFMHNGRIKERGAANRFFQAPQSPEARAFLAGEIVL